MIVQMSPMTRAPFALLLVLAGGLAGGCELKQNCSPGTTQRCACAGGMQGVQTCDSTGQLWGACLSCLAPDARVDVQGLTFPDRGPDQRPDAPPRDACKPQCAKAECGPDGCGGSCGNCSIAGTVCDAGKCSLTSLSFTIAAIFPPPPFGPNLPTSWLYQIGKKGPNGDAHSVTCTASGSSLRIKGADGVSSFQIESNAFSPAVCSLHQVADFSAALLKVTELDPWGFLPPLAPNGVGKYALNFDLSCKVTDGVLSGTFFFTVLYHGNQDGEYIDVSKGQVVCALTAP